MVSALVGLLHVARQRKNRQAVGAYAFHLVTDRARNSLVWGSKFVRNPGCDRSLLGQV